MSSAIVKLFLLTGAPGTVLACIVRYKNKLTTGTGIRTSIATIHGSSLFSIMNVILEAMATNDNGEHVSSGSDLDTAINEMWTLSTAQIGEIDPGTMTKVKPS